MLTTRRANRKVHEVYMYIIYALRKKAEVDEDLHPNKCKSCFATHVVDSRWLRKGRQLGGIPAKPWSQKKLAQANKKQTPARRVGSP